MHLASKMNLFGNFVVLKLYQIDTITTLGVLWVPLMGPLNSISESASFILPVSWEPVLKILL